MKAIFLSLVFFFPYVCSSQATLSADKTEVRIGDQIKATILLNLGDGRELLNAEHIWPDSLKGIAVVDGPVWNRDKPESSTATWSVALFDTGVVRIPFLPLVIKNQGQTDTIFTNDFSVKVMPVEPDSAGLSGIKDIYEQPFHPGYYKKYIPLLIGFLLLIAGLLLWLRQRKSKRVVSEIVAVPLLPHEWAGKALDELAERKLWQRGEIKEHYTYLTDILREYLERRFGIHAKEQTSDEILVQLSKHHLSNVLLTDIEELLSVADLIKFAKADPGMDIHAVTIERVRKFVIETIPAFQQDEAEQSKSEGDEAVQ
ncbi:MAG: hypothetical protein SH808_08915 [Saprospiraceae bacterium]|nr:hypothetical protein [Saprospiraceae bacterium]